jgi:hypothetical protein
LLSHFVFGIYWWYVPRQSQGTNARAWVCCKGFDKSIFDIFSFAELSCNDGSNSGRQGFQGDADYGCQDSQLGCEIGTFHHPLGCVQAQEGIYDARV